MKWKHLWSTSKTAVWQQT